MRNFAVAIFLLFSLNLVAQNDTNMRFTQNPYEAEWKVIDSLEQQGLPQSALANVNALYDRAKSDNNPAQVIKTMIYQQKYQSQLEDDGLVNSIQRLEAELEDADFPTEQILQSMLGQLYRNYLDKNSWRLRDRTTVEGNESTDIQTWSAEQLLEYANRYYIASVMEERTRQVPLNQFDAITQEGSNSAGLWPTLYDFLTHRAIEHFSNEVSYLNEPIYTFTLDKPEAFADAETFINTSFATDNPEANKQWVLIFFQELLRYHSNDKDPSALIDVDLKRLQFAKNNAVVANKDSLYLSALERLHQRHKAHSAAAEVQYQIAFFYYLQGQQYAPDPIHERYRLDKRKALEICDACIEQYPSESYGVQQCKWLRSQILRKSLSLQTEGVNLPNQPMLAKLQYQNVDRVYLRVIRLTPSQLEQLEDLDNEKSFDFLTGLRAAEEWSEKLPTDKDYQSHAVEFAIDKMPLGQYAVLISDNKNFKLEGGYLGYLVTQVSNLAYVHRTRGENLQEYAIVHRESGKPLAGVEMDFQQIGYDGGSKTLTSLGKERSDAQGFIKKNIAPDINYQIELRQGDDWLRPNRSYYSYYNYYAGGNESGERQTLFFLDRKIYRPGQTIYFKAMVIEKDANGVPKIVPNEPITITFYDANYQEVEEVELRTSEFGTVNGTFTAPRAGLLGQMTLDADTDYGEISFRVEEYKRPKFEVVMQPLAEGAALYDDVEVTGTAKAYAGSNVDGATVRYRVTRAVQYPWIPWWRMDFRMGIPSYGNEKEIARGETMTDANGEFTIAFTATPDVEANWQLKPMFVYNITADVIDITGETHTGLKTLRLSELTLQADVQIPENMDRSDAVAIEISTTNLDGQAEPAQGTITIHQLQAPNRTFIERYWERPDRFILTKDQFYKAFANYAYQAESQVANWERGEQVYKQNFNTADATSLTPDMSNWAVGHYELVLQTQDANAKEIEVRKYFQLYDGQTQEIPAHTLAFSQINQESFEPGEQMQLQLASSDGVHLLYAQSNRARSSESRWLDVTDWETVDYTIAEADRGNFGYEMSYVKFNRFFHHRQIAQVPWSNKDLKIEYSTFRDKLKPGQEEEWRIKISGPERERVAAEVVAAMYDASLDALAQPNTWGVNLYPSFYPGYYDTWSSDLFNDIRDQSITKWEPGLKPTHRQYPILNWFNFYSGSGLVARGEMLQVRSAAAPEAAMEDSTIGYAVQGKAAGIELSEVVTTSAGKQEEAPSPPQPIRTNLNETVFFFPELMTDAEGNVIIKFTMNEALTRWKFLAFAHTKDLKLASTQREIVTQKELMVLPNPPRFLREGDALFFTAKVSNLSERELSGKIKLEVFDAATMQPVADVLGLENAELDFIAKAGQSDGAEWKLTVPVGELSALTWRVTARAENFSDGEESSLPILTNRMLVTETLPMSVRSGKKEEFTLQNLRQAADSKTLAHHNLTLEFTSNPAWYAVQALPYLMEYPYECIEQVFNRYYANALAATVANSTPKIKQMFERWRGTDVLESNLTKNQELKSALLEETPWVLEAQSEAQQRKNIGLLFDLMRLSEEQAFNLNKIAERQNTDGGFSWFPDGRANWYITQYVVEGFGHLDHLGAGNLQDNPTAYQIIGKALQFIDNQLAEDYTKLAKSVEEGNAKWEDDHLSNIAIHYLYTRSFFPQFPISNKMTQTAIDYYLSQAEKYWLQKGIYEEGLLALALDRWKKPEAAQKIVKSLRERALQSEELGMYWKYDAGYFWHQMPIETHALMIEVFSELTKDMTAVDEMRLWLLKNKQTNAWETTKATAAAVYALLMNGSDWLSETEQVEVRFADMRRRESNETIAAAQQNAEPGIGYFKQSWSDNEIAPDMATVKVKNPNKVVAWGAMYWQYFEDLDKIKSFKETPLNIVKQVFREKLTDEGPKLETITGHSPLEPGDKLIVRIELRVDRAMEFVHLKDMRASGLEPINVQSGYRWQGGLGYYESTRDVATNFFMDYLPRGTYVFEYPLRVVHKGDFSNGITSIQCMYAPEFASHSEGIRLGVK